jgi:hypothetical protein
MRERDDSEREKTAAASNERKPYAPPRLIEYGTVAKLTQSGGATVFDFSGGMMRMMSCL